ncbi:ORF1ab polyprotein [Colletotrichum tofieldiae]|nr:ORF1ab polyprotein [Colletotrichum tofieldiae]
MRFTLALTTLVAVAMAAPLDSIVARQDELKAAIAALADESPADAEAAKSLLGRDLEFAQDDEEEEVTKRDDNAIPQLANDDEEEEEVTKRDNNAAPQLTDDDEEEEELTDDDEEEVF